MCGAPVFSGQTYTMLHAKILGGIVTSLALGASLVVSGCAGSVQAPADDGAVIDETDSTSAALSAVDPSNPSTEPGDDTGDDETKADPRCDDKDAANHKNHRKHKFKNLDALDGTKDHQITIASLPAGLPDKLIAKLHKLDVDGDGIVTKAEAKAWFKKRHHDHDGHDGPKGDHTR